MAAKRDTEYICGIYDDELTREIIRAIDSADDSEQQIDAILKYIKSGEVKKE